MELNLFHFSAAKTLAECQELNAIFRESKSFDDFVKKASVKHNLFNKTWAETEYNTAYLTAESSATYYRLKDQADIFPFWMYRTQGDEQVRASHADLDGLVLPQDDPAWSTIYPPNDWNCRCYIVPRTKAEAGGADITKQREVARVFIDSADFKKAKAQGWGVNRADLKQAFTSNQMYIKGFPGMGGKLLKVTKELNLLNYIDYGLNPKSMLMQKALKDVTKYTGTAEDWKAANTIDGNIVLLDYNSRRIIVPEDGFSKHTTGSYLARVEYLDAMKETLSTPDEVWVNTLQTGSFDNFISMKFYGDQTVVVISRIENGRVSEVKTWFPMIDGTVKVGSKKIPIEEKFRSGMLIKKSGQN